MTIMKGPPMEFKRISIDTSKHIFTLHGVDDQDRVTLRRELRRGQIEAFLSKVPPTEVALEACARAHHWGRMLDAMGHRVKLIPPQYVEPFVKRSKNDRNDAEAISEEACRTNRHSGLPARVGFVIHRAPDWTIWSFTWPPNVTSFRKNNGFGSAR